MADSSIGFGLDVYGGLCRLCSAATAPHLEDDCLIQALRRGDETAYETLIQRFQQPVYNLVFRFMNDPIDTSDVVQEVFLKVFRNIGSFQGKSSLKTWIYRISFNEAHNHRRWFVRHKKQEVGFVAQNEGLPGFEEILPDPGRSAFDLVADHETRALVDEALKQLNPVFRAAVVLRDLEDLSYEEIAEVLQVSLGTVKSRILRGREALRKALAERLLGEPAVQWNPEPAR